MAKKGKLTLALEIRTLNRDATSGVTPLVIGENPNPHRTRLEASKVLGSVQRAAIFNLIRRSNSPGKTPGSATPLTRSSTSAKMPVSSHNTPLTRSSLDAKTPPGEETPSVGVPSVTLQSGTVRLTPAAPAQDHGGASQPQSKSRETYETVGEAAEGTPPMPPVVPSDSFDVWNDLAGPKPPHRVYEDLDNLVEWANNPSQPGIRTPNSEQNTQRLL